MMRTATTASSSATPSGNTQPGRWHTAKPWISLILRVLLGAVWIVFGASKIGDLAGSVDTVRAYELLPPGVAPIVGSALPLLEIALGLMLIAGATIRFGAVISILLLSAYIVAIASVAARGLRIDCGCLGEGGKLAANQETTYTQDIVRDSVLLVIAAFLAIRPGRLWSLDAKWDRSDRYRHDSNRKATA